MRITNYMTAAAAMMLFVAGSAAGPRQQARHRSGGRQCGCAEHGRPKGNPANRRAPNRPRKACLLAQQ